MAPDSGNTGPLDTVDPERAAPAALSDSVVLITGAGGGIGSATAHAFAAAGARLGLVDADSTALEKVRADLLEGGFAAENVACFVADVSDEDAVRGYTTAIAERFGGLDTLFNNAGVEGNYCPAHEYGASEFDRVMRINVRGIWLNMKFAAQQMLRRGRGSVINSGSAVSVVGAPNLAPYAASKHAVVGLTRSIALELARSGIRVNAICPGPTDTRMQHTIEDGMPRSTAEAHQLVMELIPMHRYGTPAEIATVVLFLASPAASFITGAVISADGGMTTG